MKMSGPPPLSRADSSKDHRPLQPSTLRQSHTPESRPGSEDSNHSDFFPSSTAVGDHFMGESTPLILGSEARGRNHGTFSPRASSPSGLFSGSTDDGSDSTRSGGNTGIFASLLGGDDWKRWLTRRMRTTKMGHSSELAEQAGFRDTPFM